MTEHRVQRSWLYTWMLNGWTVDRGLTHTEGGTEFVTIGVPDDFVAVRVGLANINPSPWTVSKIIACASSSWSDYHTPIEGLRTPRASEAWSSLTFQGGGSDGGSLVTAADAPAEIAVAGNATDPATGETTNPAWTFTDWVPCASVGAEPTTGMRVLMLRALVPGSQVVTYTHGTMAGYGISAAANQGYAYFVGGTKWDADQVTKPVPYALPGITSSVLEANHLVFGQMMSLIQVMTRRAGIVGMIAGDSHMAGTSTTSGIHNFLVRGLLELGARTVGTAPVGVVSTAAGGLASRQIFARVEALLDAVRPAFVVLPCWSFNEYETPARPDARPDDVFFARMLMAAARIKAAGAVPVFVTPFPRDAESMLRHRDAWLAQREAALALRAAGEHVFDATPLLGAVADGRFTGSYLDGLSSDDKHPNDAGHAALARAFAPILRDLTGIA